VNKIVNRLLEAVNPVNKDINDLIIQALVDRNLRDRLPEELKTSSSNGGDNASYAIRNIHTGNYFYIRYENYDERYNAYMSKDPKDILKGTLVVNDISRDLPLESLLQIDFKTLLEKHKDNEGEMYGDEMPSIEDYKSYTNEIGRAAGAIQKSSDIALQRIKREAITSMQQNINTVLRNIISTLTNKFNAHEIVMKRKDELGSVVKVSSIDKFIVSSNNVADIGFPHMFVQDPTISSYAVLIVDFSEFAKTPTYTLTYYYGGTARESDMYNKGELLGKLDEYRKKDIISMDQLKSLAKFVMGK